MAERDLLVRILGDDRDIQRALTNTERRVESLDSRTAAFGKNLKTAFAAAGISVGISTVAFGLRDIAQSAIDFEEAFTGVRKTVDASEEEFAVLAAGIRGLSREIPLTVTELARIAESAGQLGVAKEDILSFTRTVADLAATTDLTSDTAADAFARLTNITGLPQEQVQNLGSAVVDLGNKLAATESEIVDFAVRIAGAGKQAGLTDAQIVAIAGAFRSVGVESEAGGTAVQKVLLSMTSAALSGGKQLELFARLAGQSVEEFREAFARDSGASFVEFVQGLEEVREEGGNVFKVLERLGFTDQRLVRAFLSMSSNSQLLADSLDIGSDAFRDNIALAEEAEKRYGTTASQIQIFKNNVNDLSITLGDELLTSLNDAVGAVKTLHDGLKALEDLAPIEIPIEIPVKLAFAGRSTSGIRDLFDKVGDEIGDSLESLFAGGKTSIENLERLFAGETGRGFTFFPSPIDEGVEQAVEDTKNSADKIEEGARGIREQESRRSKAFDAFAKGMGLKLSKAQLTEGLDDDVAVLRELERAILRQIEREGRTFKLVDKLTQTRLQIAGLVQQQARAAADTARDAFDATLDALQLGFEIASTTKSLKDDQVALRAIEQAILDRIASEGRTTELLRQLFQVRQQQADVARQLIEQRRTQRQERQFEALGLTEEGDKPTPGPGALRRRANSLEEQIKGTVLDTEKTRQQLEHIRDVLTGKFGEVGRDVRAAILRMLNDISDALDDKKSDRFGGEITRGGIRSTQRLLRNVTGLTEEQRRQIQANNLGVSGRRGFAAFGFGIDQPGTSTTGLPAGVRRGDRGGDIFIQQLTVVSNDPNDMMKKLQKKARRSSGGRRGRHGGANLGMQ